MESRKRQMHIGLNQGEVGGYCLLPGDPGRCEHIASFLDDSELVAHNREFVTYTGTLCGERVSACSPRASAAPALPSQWKNWLLAAPTHSCGWALAAASTWL